MCPLGWSRFVLNVEPVLLLYVSFSFPLGRPLVLVAAPGVREP